MTIHIYFHAPSALKNPLPYLSFLKRLIKRRRIAIFHQSWEDKKSIMLTNILLEGFFNVLPLYIERGFYTLYIDLTPENTTKWRYNIMINPNNTVTSIAPKPPITTFILLPNMPYYPLYIFL